MTRGPDAIEWGGRPISTGESVDDHPHFPVGHEKEPQMPDDTTRRDDDPSDVAPPEHGRRSDPDARTANLLVGTTVALLLVALAVLIVVS
jgi:hypothetical protein